MYFDTVFYRVNFIEALFDGWSLFIRDRGLIYVGNYYLDFQS